jgi:hypothetical protein
MLYATKISLILSSTIKHDSILLIFDVPNRNFVYYNINFEAHIVMTIQRFSYLRKYLFIFSLLFLLSGCDIINAALGGGSTSPNATKTIERIEIEFLIDNAKSEITYYNPPPNTPQVDNLTGTEFGADITSISGTSAYMDEENLHITEFDNPEVLGQLIRGSMVVYFFEDPRTVNIQILQIRSYDSSIFGHVNQTYSLKYDGIPFSQSYTDSFTDLEVDEFYISGNSVNSATAYFTEDNAIYYDVTDTTVCSSRAFIKVKVHYK